MKSAYYNKKKIMQKKHKTIDNNCQHDRETILSINRYKSNDF